MFENLIRIKYKWKLRFLCQSDTDLKELRNYNFKINFVYSFKILTKLSKTEESGIYA